jgi:hypothetical protein
LPVEPQSILARWRKYSYFFQLLNVHGIKDDRQTEIHTAEPLVPEQRASEIELAVGSLESQKSLGIDQLPEELFNPESTDLAL